MDVDPLNPDVVRAGGVSGRWTALLVGLYALVAAVTAWYALRIDTPMRFVDEFFFWDISKSIAAGHGAAWRGAPVAIFAQLYPLAIAPVFRLWGSVGAQYDAAKLIGSAAISTVVFPTYLGARLLVDRRSALLAAVFSVAVPGMIYAGLIGTEAFAYPLACAALMSTVWAIARPSLSSAFTTGIFIALSVFTRVQFVALIPVAAFSVAFSLLLTGTGDRRALLRQLRPLLVVLGSFALIGLLYLAVRGRSSVGIYQSALYSWHFSVDDLLYWLRAYAADIYLVAGILPTIATFALLGSGSMRKEPALRALLAVTLAATLVLLAQVVWFSLTNTEHWRERHFFYERYVFYLAPLYFVGFVAAFSRAGRRALLASALAGAIVLALMPSGVILQPLSLDSPGLAWIAMLVEGSAALTKATGPMLCGFSLLLSGVFALALGEDRQASLRRIACLLAVVLPMFFLVISQAKARSLHSIFAQDVYEGVGQPIDWVERAAGGGPVALLFGSGADRMTLYVTEFWNPSIRSVWSNREEPIGSPELHSPQCGFRVADNRRILPGAEPWCREVPPVWLVQSPYLKMRLRGGEPLIRPVEKSPLQTLQRAVGEPRVLYLRNDRSYVTDAR